MSKAAVGFYVGTDTQITLKSLKDILGASVNDAVVSGTLKTKQGQGVTNGNVSFTYVPSSNGDYVGNLSASCLMVPGTEYDLVIVATRSGRTITLKVTRTAAYLTA